VSGLLSFRFHGNSNQLEGVCQIALKYSKCHNPPVAAENRYFNVGILVIIIFACLLASYFGVPQYRDLKERRSVAEAQRFFDKGDFSNALICARQTLLLNSNNVAACRIMAKLADTAHSSAALDWGQRLIKLSPAIDDKLLMASFGLRYQPSPFPLTTQILDELSSNAVSVPSYHAVSAQLDLSLHRWAAAEEQFEMACKLDPTNKSDRFNLAAVQLSSTNKITAAEARMQLEQYRNDADLGLLALRSLQTDRLSRNDTPAALTYSTQILANAHANFGDRIVHLTILKQMRSPALAAQLESLQRESTTNALCIAQLSDWMQSNGYGKQEISWLINLPKLIQKQYPVQLTLANCYVSDKDWTALRNLTLNADWGNIDFLRLALLSHSWDELNEPLMANGNWRSAIRMAEGHFNALNTLLQLTERWEMEPERLDLLRLILKEFPDAGWAQHDLEAIYFNTGNTLALYELYSERLTFLTNNTGLQNNFAFTALLLKTNMNSAFMRAAEAYTHITNDASVATTYAYALHLQGRDQDGLAVLQKLNETTLRQPSVALYYGILLTAMGRDNDAKTYLQIAQGNKNLLPEERKLLSKASK
jgi:hypothetical protein